MIKNVSFLSYGGCSHFIKQDELDENSNQRQIEFQLFDSSYHVIASVEFTNKELEGFSFNPDAISADVATAWRADCIALVEGAENIECLGFTPSI